MFTNVGIGATAGVVCGVILGASVIPVVLLHLKGRSWRDSKERDNGAEMAEVSK